MIERRTSRFAYSLISRACLHHDGALNATRLILGCSKAGISTQAATGVSNSDAVYSSGVQETTSSTIISIRASNQHQDEPSAKASLDWTTHTQQQFSIRPSFLSPLYSTYKQEYDRNQRRALLDALMRSHKQLSEEVDGLDSTQQQRNMEQRIAAMQSLASDMDSLQQRRNLPECNNRNLMYGFYALLEEESQSRNPDSEAFHAVAQGKVTPWEHWAAHFVGR